MDKLNIIIQGNGLDSDGPARFNVMFFNQRQGSLCL
jgi:hypothetical protein